MNGSLITLEDLLDIDPPLDEPIRRSKTRCEMKRETTVIVDDKRPKSRMTLTRSKMTRSSKSAPMIQRAKTLLLFSNKGRENQSNLVRLQTNIPSVDINVPSYPSISQLFLYPQFPSNLNIVRSLGCIFLDVSHKKKLKMFFSFWLFLFSEIEFLAKFKMNFDVRFKCDYWLVVSIQHRWMTLISINFPQMITRGRNRRSEDFFFR